MASVLSHNASRVVEAFNSDPGGHHEFFVDLVASQGDSSTAISGAAAGDAAPDAGASGSGAAKVAASRQDMHVYVESSCERPAALPVGLAPGTLD